MYIYIFSNSTVFSQLTYLLGHEQNQIRHTTMLKRKWVCICGIELLTVGISAEDDAVVYIITVTVLF